MTSKKLHTIGHSTLSLDEFIIILKSHQIKHLVDVRTIPKSRHVPWFNEENLIVSLKENHISYLHLPKLGGLRHSHKNSINFGWRNASFRGFADYMQTADFYSGLKELNELIIKWGNVAIMCAEAVPWHCHRSLIADAEIVRHYTVMEIIGRSKPKPHQLTSFAVVNRKKRPIQIYYPDGKEDKPK